MSLRIPHVLGMHKAESHVTFDEENPKTAQDLSNLAAGVAELLGAPEEQNEVVVLCRDTFLFAGAMMGAWRAGYQVGLPPNSQPESVKSVRSRKNVKTVLHDGDGFKGLDVRSVLPKPTDYVGFITNDPARVLITVYTSGSTGEHRRCPKTAHQLLGEAGLLVDTFAGLERCNVLSMVPAHHIYGLLFGVLVPLVSGGSFRRRTARGVWEVMECAERGANVLVSVPALLGAFRSAQPSQAAFNYVFSSGAPLQQRVGAALEETLGWQITEVLGSSETGGIAHRLRGAADLGPYQPFRGITVRESEDGRMRLASPLTGEAQFLSEDLIRLHADGTFDHLGRADGIIKIGSTRIAIAEVEQHLVSIKGIRDAAVLSCDTHRNRGTELWAVVETDRRDERAIRAALGKWLNPVVIPRRFRFVDKVPRTDRGKTRRQDLLRLFEK